MTTKKNTTDKVEVVRKSDEELATKTAAQDTVPAAEQAPEKKEVAKVDTIELDVTLANGVDLTIEVVKDQADWEISAVEAMAEMNYAVLINSIITRGSKLKLKMAGAKVRDFEMITDKVSGALGVIRDEYEAEKAKK